MTDYPFQSDGCSLFPDGHWGGCCVEHDRAYHKGGTAADRAAADETMRRCVLLKVFDMRRGRRLRWESAFAFSLLMWFGVRIFGHPYWPTPFRWGYGWKYPRGYAREAVKS